MKEIIAVIRPNMYFPTRDALHEAGIFSMNSQMVYGRGKNVHVGMELNVDTGEGLEVEEYPLLAKRQMNIVVRDTDVKKVIDTIRKTAFTGEIGDGKIFSYEIRSAMKIRTGETGYDALQSWS